MSEPDNLPDHLLEVAKVLASQGFHPAASTARKAAVEILRLREAAEDVYGPWSCGEPLDREMRELGKALGYKLDPA